MIQSDKFEIKTGDTAPSLAASLFRLENGSPVDADLTDALAVRFIMKSSPRATTVTVQAACFIVDAATGQVRYDWQPGDTDTPGDFVGEFEVAWNDGTFETFPSDGFMCIKIGRDLGGAVPT